MAGKVGESWVSEAALAYAKGKVDSDAGASLQDLSKQFPGVNFTTNTAAFSQKGTNNIQIAPIILAEMKNNPDKRLEYEALIYDCAQLVYDGKMNQALPGSHIKSAGTIIHADGSLSGWSISEDDVGNQTRNKTGLDKTKKETWAEKILANRQKERAEEKKAEAKKRTDTLSLSKQGQEYYKQLSSVSEQEYLTRFEEKMSELSGKTEKTDGEKTNTFDQHADHMASVYEEMKQEIEAKYADKDHAGAYYISESGRIEELAKEKELDMLKKAYESHSELMASSTEIWQGLEDFTPSVVYDRKSGQTQDESTVSRQQKSHQAQPEEKGRIKSIAYQAFLSAIEPNGSRQIPAGDRRLLNGIWDFYANRR